MNSDEQPVKSIRVLHVNAGNLYGGLETFLVTLANSVSLCPEMTHEFALCFSGRLEREVREAGSTVYLLGETRISRPWTVWASRSRLLDLLKRERFDIVVCHSSWPQALFGPLAERLHLPWVAYFHGPTGRTWIDWLASRTRPNLLIVPSKQSLETCQPVYPKTASAVVNYPLPYNIDQRFNDGDSRERVRAELGTATDEVVILQASRMERWKGTDILIRALAQLKHERPWRCWIAGGAQRPKEKQYLEELQALIREFGLEDKIHFLGNRSDVPALMRAADIYCQGNRGEEGFSIAFLEACYVGLPVVTTNIGGAPEMVTESCGILVPPENPTALAAALRKVIQDPELRKSMSKHASERALALCDTARQIRRIYKLFSDIVSRSDGLHRQIN